MSDSGRVAVGWIGAGLDRVGLSGSGLGRQTDVACAAAVCGVHARHAGDDTSVRSNGSRLWKKLPPNAGLTAPEGRTDGRSVAGLLDEEWSGRCCAMEFPVRFRHTELRWVSALCENDSVGGPARIEGGSGDQRATRRAESVNGVEV